MRNDRNTLQTQRVRLRVCYVLAYRDSNYIRTRSLLAALSRIEGIEVARVINRHKSVIRYVETIIHLLQIRRRVNPDIYILGFRGHEIAWLVRRIARDRPLILDALMSPWVALSEERKMGVLGTVLARVWRPFERRALHQADCILTDTQLHARYQATTFGLPASKIRCIPVGAVEAGTTTLISSAVDDQDEFNVLYYGVAYEPIEVTARIGKSHIKPVRDGLRFLLIIFKVTTLYSPLKLFAPAGVAFFLLGLAYYGYTLATQHRFTNMSALLFSAAVIIFLIGLISEQITNLIYKRDV